MQVVRWLELATWNDWLWHLLTRHTGDDNFDENDDYKLFVCRTCHLKWLISDISWPDTLGMTPLMKMMITSCSLVRICHLKWLRTELKRYDQIRLWVTNATMYEWCCVYVVYAWMYEYVKVRMYECKTVWPYKCTTCMTVRLYMIDELDETRQDR